MARARRIGGNTATLLVTLPSRPCDTYKGWNICVHAHSSPHQNQFVLQRLPPRLRRSDLLLRWGRSRSAEQTTTECPEIQCVVRIRLGVWLTTPGVSSADWRLSNLHCVTWWQLENPRRHKGLCIRLITPRWTHLLRVLVEDVQRGRVACKSLNPLLTFLSLHFLRQIPRGVRRQCNTPGSVALWREACHRGSTRSRRLPTKDWVLNSTGTFGSGR